MATRQMLLPSMGEGVNEATIVRWLKNVGDKVDQDEPLLEVSTDKVDTEIPAPTGGYLIELRGGEGDVVPVGNLVAVIADAKDEAPPKQAEPSPEKAPKPSGQEVKPQARRQLPREPASADSPEKTGLARTSPLVRKMAREHGLVVDDIPGSGLGGRVTKEDVLTYLSQTPKSPAQAASPSPPEPERLVTTMVGDQEMLEGVPVRREPMSRMRQLIAKHMVESVRTSPHVTTTFEVDLDQVVRLREEHKEAFAAREGFKLTYTHFLLHAAVQAIKEHPIVNVSVDGDDILYKSQINLGCAVALESGLIVPVIKNAGELSLTGIASRLNDLVTRARNKKLTAQDVQGGTFSVTNPGGWGCITSNPIINQPQVAILGIGAIVKRPVAVGTMIAIRPSMMISLTFDHRVIDGEGGAKYLATLKHKLETYKESPL